MVENFRGVKITYGFPWLVFYGVIGNLRVELEITYSRACMYNFPVTLLMKHIYTSGSVAIQGKPHKEIKCLIFFLGKFFLTKLLIELYYPFKASIGMHIVHTALYAFLKVLIGRIFN